MDWAAEDAECGAVDAGLSAERGAEDAGWSAEWGAEGSVTWGAEDAERTYLREAWELKKTFFDHRLIGALPQHKQGQNCSPFCKHSGRPFLIGC